MVVPYPEDPVQELVAQIGIKDTVEVLLITLPHISEWRYALQQALESNDEETSQLYAYKAISSVRFYGSERLEALLQTVIAGKLDLSETQQLAIQLEQEFAYVEQKLRIWLAQHPI